MKNYIFNYTEQNPLIIDDYPYGFRLRTQIKYWIESTAKKGDRFCSQTLNPKNNRWNTPKKSTYAMIGVMYLDEKNHVQWEGVSQYSERSEIQKFVDDIGGVDKLNPLQKTIFDSLMGINKVKRDEFTNEIKKDFTVQWEKNHAKTDIISVKITFDRPDGVKIREIFEAIKTLDQAKLMGMFNGRESETHGVIEGFVRVCVRGGIQLTTVSKSTYIEYLASDENVLSDEV